MTARRAWRHRLHTAALTPATRVARSYTSPIVLYHATFSVVPDELASGLHNVTPDVLVDQIRWLSNSYELVSIDEWFDRGRPTGTACITFDDAYRSVFDEALPRLIEMGVPSTVFINGATLRGERFWRDNILFLVYNDLVRDFLASTCAGDAGFGGLDVESFYQETKTAAWNSRSIDLAIVEFLRTRSLLDGVARFTVSDPAQLIDDPLVTYGNHSYRHYVPSSLSESEQREELAEDRRVLGECAPRRSQVLSLPFGDVASFDETTEGLVSEFGYSGVLFSRNAVNFGRGSSFGGVPAGERYMAPASFEEFRLRHSRLAWMAPDAAPRRWARVVRDRAFAA